MIIDAFENKLFPLASGNYYYEYNISESEDNEEPSGSGNNTQPTMKGRKEIEKIGIIDNILVPGLVKKYFKNDSLKEMFEQTRDLIKNQSKISAKKIKIIVIEVGLKKLKNNIQYMSENEIRNKELDLLANFIEEILIGDKMNNMPPSENEEAKKIDIVTGGEVKICHH